ncbi:MAG: hypothetical protein GEU73_12470 [Chloroflexi bacterium]|nr:hypothetical protein [Chloroflexota bacterium]
MNILGMGPFELIVILGLALVIFGPDKLPELARQAGRTVAQVRRVSAELTGELQRGLQIEDTQPSPETRPSPRASGTGSATSPPTTKDDDVLQPPY